MLLIMPEPLFLLYQQLFNPAASNFAGALQVIEVNTVMRLLNTHISAKTCVTLYNMAKGVITWNFYILYLKFQLIIFTYKYLNVSQLE